MKARLSAVHALDCSRGVSASLAVSWLPSSRTGSREMRERFRQRWKNVNSMSTGLKSRSEAKRALEWKKEHSRWGIAAANLTRWGKWIWLKLTEKVSSSLFFSISTLFCPGKRWVRGGTAGPPDAGTNSSIHPGASDALQLTAPVAGTLLLPDQLLGEKKDIEFLLPWRRASCRWSEEE